VETKAKISESYPLKARAKEHQRNYFIVFGAADTIQRPSQKDQRRWMILGRQSSSAWLGVSVEMYVISTSLKVSFIKS